MRVSHGNFHEKIPSFLLCINGKAVVREDDAFYLVQVGQWAAGEGLGSGHDCTVG